MAKPANHYFDNEEVERLLTIYVKNGCTDVKLRDQVMGHASELIRQIIRTHNLHNIYAGKDQASFFDLFQTAWCQIEKTLYKFDYSPGHKKVFNLWSQIARTVMLAHIKKENRDRVNRNPYKNHLISSQSTSRPAVMERFITEAREICKYNDEHLELIDCLEEMYASDERAYEGIIGKLIRKSGKSRQKIQNFLAYVKLRSVEFTDSPANSTPGSKISASGNVQDDEEEN
jgi:hypothetical protein